jgi:hypothetical protein
MNRRTPTNLPSGLVKIILRSLFGNVALALVLALAGCSHLVKPKGGGCGDVVSSNPDTLPDTSRGSVEKNLGDLSTLPSLESLGPLSVPAYRALTPGQCQCLAVAAVKMSLLEDQEGALSQQRENSKSMCSHRHSQNNQAVREELARQVVLEAQNRQAGLALETYYRLAEAEGKAELLSQGTAQVREAMSKTRSMTEHKLRPPVEYDVWLRQNLTLQSDGVQLELTILQLNALLRRSLDLCGGPDDYRLWNPEEYRVSEEAIDVEAAVAQGLAQRPDLAFLRTLIANLSPDTLPLVRLLLQAANPTLGSQGAPKTHPLAQIAALLHRPDTEEEMAARRRQLQVLLGELEKTAAEEIRTNARAVPLRFRMVRLAQERAQSCQARVKDVLGRQEKGLALFAEVTQAQMEWLKARAEVIQEVMAWYVAHVKLQQAMGVLPLACAGKCGK